MRNHSALLFYNNTKNLNLVHQMQSLQSLSFYNKENIDFANRSAYSKMKSIQKRIQLQVSSESETDSNISDSHAQDNLVKFFKRQKLRVFITKILQARRRKDRQDSQKQIFSEVLLFKIFSGWKKLTQKTLKKTVQAQLFKQRKQYHLFKICFSQWADLIRKPKLKSFNLKKKWFQELKIACSSELSLRLKRIQLQNYLLRKRLKQVTKHFRQQVKQVNRKNQKAQLYFSKQRKNIFFKYLKSVGLKDKDEKIRFQQYKLAYLFRTKCLLLRGFRGLRLK